MTTDLDRVWPLGWACVVHRGAARTGKLVKSMRQRATSRGREKLALLAVGPLILTAALSGAPAGAAQDTDADVGVTTTRSAPKAVIRIGHASTPTVVGSLKPASTQRRAATASFDVTYTGFTPEAQAAFQRAVDIWATQIGSRVPITVNATFTPLTTGVLGKAGPGTYTRDFPGAPVAKTWYAEAIANKRAGMQLSPSPDINAQFNSTFPDFWFGEGAAPAGQADFTSVVMHELGHGLGFLGAGAVTSGRGTVRIARFPMTYDRYTENARSKAMLAFPDQSTGLAAQLKSNKLYFDSAKVRNANGGNRARVFAPATWQPGSSYNHLNEATYQQGNANSLMTPGINYGETIRKPGPITKAIFFSTGW